MTEYIQVLNKNLSKRHPIPLNPKKTISLTLTTTDRQTDRQTDTVSIKFCAL